MKVRYGAHSDVGMRRDVNQDCYGIAESLQYTGFGTVLVVCDGMGGHFAGEVASQLGVGIFLQFYYESNQDDRPALLQQAFAAANQYIYTYGHGTMGTTGVAALLIENRLYIANVGDSRAYLIRDGAITQVSQDHSFVAEQVAAGLLTPEQARMSVHRNMITRALGYQNDVEVDLFAPGLLQPDDIVLLSTDGLHSLVEDAELAQVVVALPPDQAVQHLIDMANERGGTDNITAVIARIMPENAADDPLEEMQTEPVPVDQSQTTPITKPLSTPSFAPLERRLSRTGIFLALLTLLVLISVGALALMV